MNFEQLLEINPEEVSAVNEFARKKNLTTVSLPAWYEIAWALVDGRGIVKNWVHFLKLDLKPPFGAHIPIDLDLWRAGRSLCRDTGAAYIFIIQCSDGAIYYLAAPYATWEFGIDQETLSPLAYVPSNFLINAAHVEQQL